MFLGGTSMDVIKTSLIIAIGITLYYLLLQWPVDAPSNDVAYLEGESINTVSYTHLTLPTTVIV